MDYSTLFLIYWGLGICITLYVIPDSSFLELWEDDKLGALSVVFFVSLIAVPALLYGALKYLFRKG